MPCSFGLPTMRKGKGKVEGIRRSSMWLIPVTSALELVVGTTEPITPGHRVRVTTELPQFTFHDSDVTTLCLTSRTYTLRGEHGRWGIGKTTQTFLLRLGIEPGLSRL